MANIDHLGIVVRSIEQAQRLYQALGLTVLKEEKEIEIGAGGRLHFLVDPSATIGVLLEICQDPISAV
jgi:catechol 2,3-dioxygenase-like lactoylglutathione lyase family enzyme